MPRRLNEMLLYFSSGRKSCISKYLGIYTCVVKIHLTLNHLIQWYPEHFIFDGDHFGLFDYVLLPGSADVSSLHSKPIWENQQKPQLSQPLVPASCCSRRQRCCGVGTQTQALLPHPMAQKDLGAGSPGAPRQQLSGEQVSFVPPHSVLLHSPAATVAFLATLGCLVFSDPV